MTKNVNSELMGAIIILGIILVGLLVVIFYIAGSLGKEISNSVCQRPYVWYKEECCLDENNNNICDDQDYYEYLLIIESLKETEKIKEETNYQYYEPVYESQPTYQQIYPKYICGYNAYNCRDFRTQREAKEVYEFCGGRSNDVHWLDEDKDGRACEWSP